MARFCSAKLATMSSFHLPVFRPTLAVAAYPETPGALPGRAVAVLDPLDGQLGLAFAARLAGELSARGQPPPVAIASFERAPAIASWQRACFSDAQPLHPLSAQAEPAEIAERLTLGTHALWVVAGQAALAFAPALTILVGADLPVTRWPDALRIARARITLALSGDGLAVAVALGRALAPAG